MPLERFIPKSPDMFIRNSQDFEVAKFGHLNTIVEYINNNSAKPAGLNGYVQFNDNAALGGDPGLFWDNVNKRLGVGTITPNAKLVVNSTTTPVNATFDALSTVTILGGQQSPLRVLRTGGQPNIYIGTSNETPDHSAFLAGIRTGAWYNTASPTYSGQFGAYYINRANQWGTQTSASDLRMAHVFTCNGTTGRLALFITPLSAESLTNSDYVAVNNLLVTTAGNFGTQPTARVQIVGDGSTAATTSLLVQNSTGAVMFSIKDNSTSLFTGFVTNYGGGSIDTNTAFGSSALGRNSTGANNTAFGLSAIYNNTTGNNNTGVGYLSLAFNNGSNNVAVGYRALTTNTSGSLNVAVGVDALITNTIGTGSVAVGYQALNTNNANFNTAIGYRTLFANTTGSDNVAVGIQSMLNNTSGANNAAIGRESLRENLTGSNNTALGHSALLSNLASNNTAVGYQSGYSNTTGIQITAIGSQALKANTTGGSNTAVGDIALTKNTTGAANVAVGSNCLNNNTTGNSNVAVGDRASAANTTAAGNVAIGQVALQNTTTGGGNTAIGYNSINANTTGTNNSALGANTVSGNFSGSVILGVGAAATANNQFVVGSSSMNAGTIDTAAVAPTQRWKVKINGTDYYIALQPA
jgi:hypothetical protein